MEWEDREYTCTPSTVGKDHQDEWQDRYQMLTTWTWREDLACALSAASTS